MYNPSPFLISSAALTSIFSFFFGGYFREREKAYRYWIRYLAYDLKLDCEEEIRTLCAEFESKERVFRQAKGLLVILLLTLFLEFVVFQFYSLSYIRESSPYFQSDAWHTYLCFTVVIGGIVLINFLEMLYIKIAVSRKTGFPYFRLRHRVSGQDRLSLLWKEFDCHSYKNGELKKLRIPRKFYNESDEEGE